MTAPVRLYRPGSVDYTTAWRWQVATAQAIRLDCGPETLALLQHPPVYTFGRRVRPEHLLLSRVALAARGAEVIESDRGGDVTFHGAGQLVVYPILDLRRRCLAAGDYVWLLEATLLRALDNLDVKAERVAGRRGVWSGGDKLAAIGVRVSDGVSLHGCALNVDVDLAWFEAIVPCGISDAGVTSLARLLGRAPALEMVDAALIEAFEAIFDCTLQTEVSRPSTSSGWSAPSAGELELAASRG